MLIGQTWPLNLTLAIAEFQNYTAALDKPTAVLPPSMQEAIMEEMEQKQARKHGKNPTLSHKGSKKQIELAPVEAENDLTQSKSYKQLNSPHSQTKKVLNVGSPNEADPNAIKAGGVGQGGGGQNGVADTYDNILRTTQSVAVEFETSSALSTHDLGTCFNYIPVRCSSYEPNISHQLLFSSKCLKALRAFYSSILCQGTAHRYKDLLHQEGVRPGADSVIQYHF